MLVQRRLASENREDRGDMSEPPHDPMHSTDVGAYRVDMLWSLTSGP